jgi:hypothetical protein
MYSCKATNIPRESLKELEVLLGPDFESKCIHITYE